MKRRQARSARPPDPLTTIELDPTIWKALQDIAAQQRRTVQELLSEIAGDSLYIAIHVYIAEFYAADATNGEDTGPNGS